MTHTPPDSCSLTPASPPDDGRERGPELRTCAVVIVAELFPEVAQVGAQIDGPQQPPLRANLPVVFQLQQRRQTDRLMAVQLSRGRHMRRRRVPREEIALRIIESGQFDRRLGPQRFEQFLRVSRLPSDETISVSRAASAHWYLF